MSSTLKKYSALGIIAPLAFCAFALVVRAEETVVNQTSPSATASASVNVGGRPAPAQRPNFTPVAPPRRDIKEYRDTNRDIRNKIIDEKKDTLGKLRTEEKDARGELKEKMNDARDLPPGERGQAMKKVQMERKEMKAAFKKDEFAARQKAFMTGLNLSIKNLETTRDRLALRAKEIEAKGTVNPTAGLLDIANKKIEEAKIAVAAVAALNTTNASTTASGEISATKPRELGEIAIKSIDQARKALIAVHLKLNEVSPLLPRPKPLEKKPVSGTASTTVTGTVQ